MRVFFMTLAAMLLLTLEGCSKPPAARSDANSLRIVTLSPALSQMVVDLGQGSKIVGVQENDAAAPEGLPVVGTFFDVDAERLLSLNPTVVLTMTGAGGVPTRLKELATSRDFKLAAYPYPNRLRDIGWILAHRGKPSWKRVPNVPSVGRMLGEQRLAQRVAKKMFAKLAAFKKLTADLKRPRVLLVIGTHPLMASGPNTVNDQLLRIAGGRNAAEHSTVRAPTFGRESLLKLNPQVIIFLSPGALPLAKADQRLRELKGLNIAAVKDGRISLINNPLTLLPSPSVVAVAAAMTTAVHPTLAPAVRNILHGDARE